MTLYFLLVIQQLIVGATHIVAKAIVDEVEPIRLTLLRALVSGLIMLGILLLTERTWRIERKDYLRILWLSLLAVPINQFLFFHGITHTTASNAALMYATTPVAVLVLSRYILGELITWKKVVGVTLALAGVSSVIFEHGFRFDSASTYGNLVLMVGVLAWAFYTIHGKPMILKYGALHVTSLTMILGMILFLPVGLLFGDPVSISTLTFNQWEGILYLAIGTSILGYYLWYYALGKIEAGKLAVFSNAQPFITTILAVLLLEQSISATFIVGGVVTVTGVVLVQLG